MSCELTDSTCIGEYSNGYKLWRSVKARDAPSKIVARIMSSEWDIREMHGGIPRYGTAKNAPITMEIKV